MEFKSKLKFQQPYSPLNNKEKYIINPEAVINENREINKNLIVLPNSSFLINNNQLDVLYRFKYLNYVEDKNEEINKLNKKFIEKKILISERYNSAKKNKLLIFFIALKNILRIKIQIFIPKSVETFLKNSRLSICICLLATTVIPIDLWININNNFSKISFSYNELNIYIIYGSLLFTGILHELFIIIFTYSIGCRIDCEYIRITLFVMLTFITKRSSLYVRTKKERTMVMIKSIYCLVGSASLINLLGNIMCFYKIKLGLSLVDYSLVSLYITALSLFPFLIRCDGYSLLQECLGVYGLRSKFWKEIIIQIIIYKRNAFSTFKNKKEAIITSIWGICHIISIIGVLYCFINGIQLIP